MMTPAEHRAAAESAEARAEARLAQIREQSLIASSRSALATEALALAQLATSHRIALREEDK